MPERLASHNIDESFDDNNRITKKNSEKGKIDHHRKTKNKKGNGSTVNASMIND